MLILLLVAADIGRRLEFGRLGRVGGGKSNGGCRIGWVGDEFSGIFSYSDSNLVDKPWLYDILLAFLEEALIVVSVFKSDTITIIIIGACNAEGNIRPNSYAPQNFALPVLQ